MTSLSKDLREKVTGLYTFAELFGFNWHDGSDWTWADVAHEMANRVDAEEAELLDDIDTLFKKVDEYSEWHCQVADMLGVEIDVSDMTNAPTDSEIQGGIMLALRKVCNDSSRVAEADSRWEHAVKDASSLLSENEAMRCIIGRMWRIIGGSKDEYEGIGTVAEIMELAPMIEKLGIE